MSWFDKIESALSGVIEYIKDYWMFFVFGFLVLVIFIAVQLVIKGVKGG
jgi:hypothetical protein